MINYITQQSFRCLLGVQSRDIEILDNLFVWKVSKKQHFSVEGCLTPSNIENLKKIAPSNFHYINQENLDILKQNFKVDKAKNLSIVLNIEDLSFSGNQNKSIRHCLNRANKEGFVLENNYRKIEDVKLLVKEWGDNYTDHYFRNNSGKNFYFYHNNFHKDLISLFVYKKNDLVAFGTLSIPNAEGYSSYVLGKSLWKRFYGLSEFADVELYKLGQAAGIKKINMGQASKKLLDYKAKFPHIKETHYDGSIECFS
jgi:phosphatidylglycerol lysyltransferase-like protein